MRALISGVLLLTAVLSVQAQVPGYKGKRFVVSGELLTFPCITNPNQNFSQNSISFQHSWAGKVDYTISKNISWGVGLTMFKTGLRYAGNSEYYYDEFGYSQTVDRGYITYYHLKGTEFSTFFKFFSYQKKGSLAPVGAYNEIGVHVGSFKNVLLAGYQSDIYKNMSTSYGALSWTMGFRNVYAGRIITDIGFRSAFPTTAFSVIDPREDYDYYYGSPTSSYDDNLKAQSQKRLTMMYIFNVKLGIGILL